MGRALPCVAPIIPGAKRPFGPHLGQGPTAKPPSSSATRARGAYRKCSRPLKARVRALSGPWVSGIAVRSRGSLAQDIPSAGIVPMDRTPYQAVPMKDEYVRKRGEIIRWVIQVMDHANLAAVDGFRRPAWGPDDPEDSDNTPKLNVGCEHPDVFLDLLRADGLPFTCGRDEQAGAETNCQVVVPQPRGRVQTDGSGLIVIDVDSSSLPPVSWAPACETGPVPGARRLIPGRTMSKRRFRGPARGPRGHPCLDSAGCRRDPRLCLHSVHSWW